VRKLLSIGAILCSMVNMAQKLEPCRNDSGLFGFCDTSTGEVVITHQYFDALEFIGGHAAVQIEDKWGIINEEGNILVEPQYDEVYNCVNTIDQILVQSDGKWFFINSFGIQLTRQYEVRAPWHVFELNGKDATFPGGTWFGVSQNEKWGIVDINDEVKIPFDYDWTRVIRREIAGKREVVSFILKKDEKYAWQRADAGAATGFEYDRYLGEYQDFLFFHKNGQPEILNAISGDRVQNTNRNTFNLIDDEDSVGLVDGLGRIIVPFRYDKVDIGSVPGYAVAGNYRTVGLYSISGKQLLADKYEDIKVVKNDTTNLVIAVRNKEDKVAVMELKGNTTEPITDFIYDYAVEDDGRIKIKRNDKIGYLTLSGEEQWK